jgi:hypothetical protein
MQKGGVDSLPLISANERGGLPGRTRANGTFDVVGHGSNGSLSWVVTKSRVHCTTSSKTAAGSTFLWAIF